MVYAQQAQPVADLRHMVVNNYEFTATREGLRQIRHQQLVAEGAGMLDDLGITVAELTSDHETAAKLGL